MDFTCFFRTDPMGVAFVSEAEPARRAPIKIREGLFRMVAGNPGSMTYHGTNSWLLETERGMIVIDPGPDDPAHVAAIAAAGRIAMILLTHTHPDHVGGAPALQAATGAPILGWGRPWAQGFTPDAAIADGETIGPLRAIHTPGHASDHLCFALDDGTVFTGDHVMSWNTSIVSPPDGDMAAYMASLRLLLQRPDKLYLCGHGPPLENPEKLVRALLLHRSHRETAVLGALGTEPRTEHAITEALYSRLEPNMVRAAARIVLAHLIKLQAETKALRIDAGWVKI